MKCQPGDLAFVIQSTIPENIGLLVEVIEPYRNERVQLLEEGFQWRCKAKGRISYTNVSGQRLELVDGPIPDWALQPIRPPKIAKKCDAKKQQPVLA